MEDHKANWRIHAACGGHDQTAFFGVVEGSRRVQAALVSKARAVCFSCPVRNDCLEDAVARGEEFGVWGGLTPEERETRFGLKSKTAVCPCCGAGDADRSGMCGRCRVKRVSEDYDAASDAEAAWASRAAAL